MGMDKRILLWALWPAGICWWGAVATAAGMPGEPFELSDAETRAAMAGADGVDVQGRTRLPLAGKWLVQPVFPQASDEYLDADLAKGWPDAIMPGKARWQVAEQPGNWRDSIRTVDGKPTAVYTAAWLVKEAHLDALKPGQKALLCLDHVWGGITSYGEKDFDLIPSHVYVNGTYVGSLTGWVRRRFDITPFLRDGRAQIAVLNGTPGLAGKVDSKKIKSNAYPAGMFNPPSLEITRPSSTWINEVLVTPSVRQKTLEVAATVVADAPATLRFKARLWAVPMFEARKAWPPGEFKNMKPRDWLLEPAATVGQRPIAEMGPSVAVPVKAGRTEVRVTFPAGELEMWSPAHPRLYWISLVVIDARGGMIDASMPVTFGYREIWVDGPNIMLNGMPVHFFGPSHNYYGSYYWTPVDLAAKHHINMTMDRTLSTWWRAYKFADQPAQLADRWGHLYSINPKRETAILSRYLCNSPAFVMWQYSGNGFVNGPHSHPMQIGGLQRPPAKDDPRHDQYAAVMEKAAAVRKVDSTRPLYFYRLGWGGDIRAIMAYLDINEPVMDMMDWPLEWYRNARRGRVEPFMPAEVSVTLAMCGMHYWKAPAKYMAGRLGHVEHAARIFGDRAYGMIRAEEIAPETYEHPLLLLRNVPDSEIVTKMYSHLYSRVYRAWRAMGMSFLLHIDGKPSVQFADMQAGVLNERGKVFRRVTAPLMAYLAGPGDDFNDLSHAFTSGETIRKQVLCFNDTFRTEPVAIDVAIRATVGGEEMFAKQEQIEVPNGRRMDVPIEFAAPDVAARTGGTIEARVIAGGEELEVLPFAFEIFPKATAPVVPGAGIVLIDPIGDTAAMLAKAGVRCRKVGQSEDFGEADLLVIGRDAYAKGVAKALHAEAVVDHLAGGGNVIVFEQSVRHVAGSKNEHFNLRHTFIRDAAHPLFQGLSDADLSHWRGESDILTPYQHFEKTGFDWTEPRTNWAKHGVLNQWGQRRRFEPQWSNRNMVATSCYHKPQAGRFRVLLDGGFDSLFTPLVEIRSQAGRVLLCQLDVTNRCGVDPVITLLVNRMVDHYSRKTEPANGAVSVLGGADTRTLVQKLGFAPADGKPSVIVLQPGAASPEQAAEAVEAVKAGATCLVLGAAEASDFESLRRAGLITFDWTTGTTDAVSLEDAPALLAGLSASDFFYRRAMPGVLAKAGGPGWRGAAGLLYVVDVGKGQVVYLAVRPEVFEGERRADRPVWQETLARWRTTKYYRIVSTILSNAGAAGTVKADLLSSGRSPSLYVHDAIDFDPMESRTW